jgi:hypothetical protein
MRMFHQLGHTVLYAVCALLLLAAMGPAAEANWLTKLGKLSREAGEVGTKAAKHGVAGLDNAAAHIKALPAAGKGAAIAAHATTEGHWKFVNRDGEVFTAGTPDELKRAIPSLLPEGAAEGRLAIYLTEDSVFRERALLKDLPDGADLHLVAGRDSYRLVRRGTGYDSLFAFVRPHLLVEVKTRPLFREAVALLERPLRRSSIRTLALQPGGPERLPSAARFEPATKAALVDPIDPAKLSEALASVRGQTVLITGRVEGTRLHFHPESGSEQSLNVLEVIAAAADNDVNLVLLHAPVPGQPGGRNWLWQRISVDGLDDALKRPRYGDFLDAMGASRGTFRVSVTREGSDRVLVRARPEGSVTEPITGTIGDWVSSAVSNVTGELVTSAVEIYARDKEREKELSRRIVPGVRSDFQIAYILLMVVGLMGWPVSRGWWARLWPTEERREYGGAIGYRAAQFARFAAFFLVFMPIVGVPAALVALLQQVVGILLLPFRFLQWLFGRTAKAG